MHKQTQPFKIGLVCDDSLDKTDGVQQYVLSLGEWLTKSGHVVHYLTSTTERTDLTNLHSLSKNIPVRFNSNRNHIPLPASYRQVKTLLEKENFDVLHIQMPYSPLLAGMIIQAAPLRTAVIGTFHIFPQSQLVSYATQTLGYILRWQLRRFDHVISVSSAAQEFAFRAFRLESEIVPNMVDIMRFRVQREVSKNKEYVNIVFLGRLVERKGAMQLLKAVEFLQRNYKTAERYRVIVGGKGPLFEELDNFVKDHDMPMVRFTGFVPEEDKASLLASADIAVFPSTGGESFGISLIEAMAASPGAVLAGDNEGYRTVMQGSKNQLFDPHDTPAFAHLLATYVDDPKRREKAYAWQTKHVRQFDTNVVAPKVLELYREALHKRNK